MNSIIRKIQSQKGGTFVLSSIEDVEYSNPIELFERLSVRMVEAVNLDMIEKMGVRLTLDLHGLVLDRARQVWNDRLFMMRTKAFPDNLKTLLDTTKKKGQVRLLRGLEISSSEFGAFIYWAYHEKEYLYSTYRAEHEHSGFDDFIKPKLLHIKGDTITTAGDTDMSYGQLKQLLEHRKVVVSKFFDKGDNWHCFFLTYKSLGGKEKHNDGHPHLHYISSAWGIPRDSVVAQLKDRKYSLPSLPHINYIREDSF